MVKLSLQTSEKQIAVTKDRNFVRFLWCNDIENININNILTAKLTLYRIFRLFFGVKLSPVILSPTLQKHIMTYKHGATLK